MSEYIVEYDEIDWTNKHEYMYEQIVRCYDCRYYTIIDREYDEFASTFGVPKKQKLCLRDGSRCTEPDDFCSCGERKMDY